MAPPGFYTPIAILQKLTSQTSQISARSQDVPLDDLQGSPFRHHPDRLVKVLDALASICLHEPKGQVVAVSASLATDTVALFVSQNNKVEQKVQTHLENVWDLMRRLAASLAPVDHPDLDQISPPRWPNNAETTADLEAELREAVYRFCYAKQVARLEKQSKKLESFLEWLPKSKGSQELIKNVTPYITTFLRLSKEKMQPSKGFKVISEGFHAFALLVGKDLDQPGSEFQKLESEYNCTFEHFRIDIYLIIFSQ
jgi:hypothetical protein